MKWEGYLDFDFKYGKVLGGYNYFLYEFGIFFIFMNVVGIQWDVIIMVYEGGYVVYSFLSCDFDFIGFKLFFFEVVELVFMFMEFMIMEEWKVFY